MKRQAIKGKLAGQYRIDLASDSERRKKLTAVLHIEPSDEAWVTYEVEGFMNGSAIFYSRVSLLSLPCMIARYEDL